MPDALSVADALASVLARIPAAGKPVTILIDGPSGSGKSTFADLLTSRWPADAGRPQLVRLDDVYPGWSGLEAASRALTIEVLAPRGAGRNGRWQRWDWVAGTGAEWHPVSVDRPLVVEGCGTLSQASATMADLRIWIEADGRLRKSRALERDAGAFDAHWDEWEEQWLRFVERERPAGAADIRVNGD
ncbi:MAG: ATP-binding protein [Leifsonia sp.]